MSAKSHRVVFDPAALDEVFADLDQTRSPGVAVGVSLDGAPVYRRGFGLANMELPLALDTRTRMRMGSVTKQFAAFAFMLLCEEGLASPDDTLGAYLPQAHLVARAVTVRELMGNVSGLRDATDIRFRFAGFEGAVTSAADLVRIYSHLDSVDAPPGVTWMYNNGGFLLLSAVIERIAGKPLWAVMRERIFDPLGMYDTELRRSDVAFAAHSAAPHTLSPDGVFEKRFWGVEFEGAGALVASVDDMLRWLANMHRPRIGSAETWAAMRRPLALRNGRSTGYGLGLIVGDYRGLPVVHHGGGWMGGNAQVLTAPSVGLAVVVASNRSDAYAPTYVQAVVDRLVPDLAPGDAPASPSERAAFSLFRRPSDEGPAAETATRAYRSAASGRVIQLFHDGPQLIVSIDGHDLPYVTCCDGLLRPIPTWRFVQRFVTPIALGEASEHLVLDDFGERDELWPLSPPEPPDTGALVGRYRSDGAQVDAEALLVEGGARLQTRSPFGSMAYDLEALGPAVWRAHSRSSIFLDSVLTFDPDGFCLSSYNTRALRFRRAT